ncbi:unnamed protein product [Spirodela intermedia]|uniref:Uncharacterized protein n=1 Tax=Spirodela intermedia TaxID=51605 RepID=A0A7I8IPU0_SPIIN|nr:unnamed protein product [Spirodela intermedia]CAA6659918.1 unnamed protein product [Spirodela intermedia]
MGRGETADAPQEAADGGHAHLPPPLGRRHLPLRRAENGRGDPHHPGHGARRHGTPSGPTRSSAHPSHRLHRPGRVHRRIPGLPLLRLDFPRKRLRSWASHNRIIYLLRGGGFDSAWETLEHLRGGGAAPPPPFEALISAYAAEGRTDKAVECFQRMGAEFGCRSSAFTYNTLMRVLIEEGISLLAQSLYCQMLKVDCRPNRSTFAILIDGLCKDGKTDDALALFDEMSQRRIPPNILVYTVVLSGLCRAGRLADAHKLLDSMAQGNLRPDSATYNALLNGFCKLGRTDEAFELVSRLPYSSLLDGLFREGKFDEAHRCYRTMVAEQVPPDCVLYTIMIRGSVESGRIREAFAFLGEMTDRGIVPDSFCYNTLIKGLCDAGHLDRARSLQLDISGSDRFPDVATYTILICGLCDRGLVREAQKIFDEMGQRGCAPTVATFNALIRGLCRAELPEEGRHLLYRMEMGTNQHLFLRLSQGPNPVSDRGGSAGRWTISATPAASWRPTSSSGARRRRRRARHRHLQHPHRRVLQGEEHERRHRAVQGAQVQGLHPDAVTYATLVGGYLGEEKADKAVEVFHHMVRNGFEPVLPVYNIIMKELCGTNRVWQAVALWLFYLSERKTELHRDAGKAELLAAARRSSDRGSVGRRWMMGLCRVGQIAEAYTIFSALCEQDADVGPPMCARLIQSFCRGGRTEWALEVMEFSLRKGISFGRPVGNRVLKFLWDKNKKDALKLAGRMSRTGYALDVYLRKPMKHHLRSYGLCADVG